jgi:hypothetical protein
MTKRLRPIQLCCGSLTCSTPPPVDRCKCWHIPGRNLANIDSAIQTQVLTGGLIARLVKRVELLWVGRYRCGTNANLSSNCSRRWCLRAVPLHLCVWLRRVYCQQPRRHQYTTLTLYNQQTITDWNGPTCQPGQHGLVKDRLRAYRCSGGTNSPSGLFWATDSLIRVSFTGTYPAVLAL